MFKKLVEIRNNILIGNRHKLIVLVSSVLIIILCFVSLRSISKINTGITQINEVHIKSLVKLSGLVENIYGILIESHIVDESSLNENSIQSSVNLDLINTYLTEYEQTIGDPQLKELYDGFLLEFQNYLNILREVNSLSFKGKHQLASELRNGREYQSYKKLQSFIKSMMDYNANGIAEGYQKIEKLKQKSVIRVYFVGFLIITLIFLVTFFFSNDLSNSIKLLTRNLSVLSGGQIPDRLLPVSKSEIGVLAGLTNSLTSNISALNQFANDISRGNLVSEYELAGQDDLLGKALINLRNSLLISKEEDEKRKIEEERRNWTNQGHTIFGEILRQRSRELSQLTDDIIKNLVYYLKANQGGLFIINDSLDIPKIELISAFAYDRKKYFERSINIGDGLIGTVALERNTVYLTEIPEDYIEIESGLGDASPKFLLIVPLKFEEDILGIVELASFREFLDYEIKFVEEVAQSIASTLLTARINARTEQLLDESRKQSEELALQEVESRQNLEEMRAAQELAQRREADLTGILSAVDNTLMKGEYELDGTLISVNNRHLQTMGYQLKEIKGKNIEMFVPKEELEHFRKVWANVVAGNPRQLEVRRHTKTGEILWLINQYTPVTDVSGKISKILYLAHDITRYKKSEEESVARETAMEFKEEELQNYIRELDKTRKKLSNRELELENIYKTFGTDGAIIELDSEAKILKINNKAANLFGLNENEVIGKIYHELIKPLESDENFSLVFDKLKSKQTQKRISKYAFESDKVIWASELFIPLTDSEQTEEKILVIINDITLQRDYDQLREKLRIEAEKQAEEFGIKESELKKLLEQKSLEKGTGDHELVKTLEALNQSIPKVVTDINFSVITVNNKFTEVFKYHERELLNKHINRILPVSEKELLEIPHHEFKEGEAIEIQLKIQTKDRQLLTGSFTIIPIEITKPGKEKLQIYISAADFGSLPDDQLTREIEAKKLELKLITDQLEQAGKDKAAKAKTGGVSDPEALYTKWIKSLKSQNNKK